MVITGLGVVTPLGHTVERMWQNLLAGVSAPEPITRFEVSGYPARFAAQVSDFHPEDYMEAKLAKRRDRNAQFAVAAARQALEEAGLRAQDGDPGRVGVLVGTGVGGMEFFEEETRRCAGKGAPRASPFLIPRLMGNAAAAHIAIDFGFQGPNMSIATACASGAHSVGEALCLIRRGEAEAMVAGGTEAPITPMGLGGFCACRALSTRNHDYKRASRPFDRERDGFVLGEGAGILVLEELEHARQRGAPLLAELLGYGASCDAYDIVAPLLSGQGAAEAITRCLKDACLNPEEVDYFNAHGTSTKHNDFMETNAIKIAFGDHARRLPISSTKSMIGHLVGAAGSVELIATVLALRDGVIPPTINYEFPDPDCDLDYVPNTSREAPVHVALSNSLGFGGHNAVLAVRRFTG